MSAEGAVIENVTVEGNTLLGNWNSAYGIQVYDTKDVVLSDVTISGFDAAILVNGSEVTLEGTVDVSGNEFGGIEVSKGSGLSNASVLTVNGEVVNSTEADDAPTAWTECEAKGENPRVPSRA